MLSIGDKIKMITNVGKFNMVGEVFEITSLPDNEIHFFHKDWGFGYMSEDEFEKHFEKVEIKQWTDWIETKDGFSYKTDNTKYVRLRKDGYEVKSSCHPCDTFNLAKGIAVCLQKVKDKNDAKQEEFENSKITYDSRFDILYIDFVEQPTYGYSEWLEKGVYLRKDSETDKIIGIHIEEFAWANYVAPGIYLKMKSGTNEVVGIHIDDFRWKCNSIYNRKESL